MGAVEVEVAVIGAGIAGLAAARELAERGRSVRLIDPAERAGGVISSAQKEGFRFERGPNALQVKPAALPFLRREGLEPLLLRAGAEARIRQIYRGDRLEPVPGGVVAAVRSPLLSATGKLRVLGEPFVRRGDGAGESVAEFTSRRLGREAYERLVAPFLVGVYAGDAEQLGAEAVFPSLVEYERERGSIVLGALAAGFQRGRPRGLSGSHSTATGLGALCDALAERLGDSLQLRTRVAGLEREDGSWTLALEGDGAQSPALRASELVIACGAGAAAELLRGHDAEAAALLAGIRYAPMLSIPLDIDPAQVASAPRGFGFLVPPDAGIALLGGLFMSRVFPDRAPPGRELVMALIGGQRWPGAVDSPDDAVLERVAEGLERSLGHRGELRPLAVTRWRRAIPQPDRDHRRRIAALRERVMALPGVALAGAYLDGVAVADALASGVRAAASLEA